MSVGEQTDAAKVPTTVRNEIKYPRCAVSAAVSAKGYTKCMLLIYYVVNSDMVGRIQ